MASWPTPAPAPAYVPASARAPSHSRSPRRRDSYPDSAAAPYADPPAAAAQYEWGDPHRKAWDEYYDRRATGRSRSPLAEEASRKRRRSVSPYERDRFDPRPRYGDDYDTHSRAHGYTSPRRGSYHNAPPPPGGGGGRRPPMDPYFMEPSAASLRQFAEWFRYYYPAEAKEEDSLDRAAEKEAGKRTRDGIRTRWEKYKKQHTANQLQTLFDHHKKSPWFNEKYNPAPEWVNLRSRVRKQGWMGRSEQFLIDLEEGKYDPQSEPEPGLASEPEPVPAPEAESPVVKEEEKVKDEPLDDAKNMDDMEGVEDEARENGPDSPTKSEANGKSAAPDRVRRDDEVLVAPDGLSMAIRTIPPDIGRQKIEEACRNVPGFVHLALGEPLQKKNYYRAGWIKFKDDTDMQAALRDIGEKKIEGFKLHLHYIARPFYTRLRTAPEVASTHERLEKDLNQAKQLAVILEDEYAVLRRIMAGAPEPKIEDNRKHYNGKDADVAMSDGGAPEAEAEATEEEADPGPLEKGSEAVERRIEKLVDEMQVEGELSDTSFEIKKTTLALDLYLVYLRAAFNTCYYCAAVCDHVEELQRKCPKHIRKPQPEKSTDAGPDEAGEEKEDDEKAKKDKDQKDRGVDRRWERNDERWQESVDSKVALLINRTGIDPLEYGGKNYDDELTKAVEPHTKQEDEGKFRCRTCQKLFKATAFVEKHVANKHPELVRQLDELPFFNNFALDPLRIQPFSHLPPVTGNSAVPPPQAYGLQGSYGGAYGAPAEFGRPMQSGGGYGGGYPPHPQYANGGHGDYYGGQHWSGPPRRDEGHGRRLQERVGGYAHQAPTGGVALSGVEGLPAKPVGAMEPGPGPGRRGRGASGPAPPPPPDAKEDPRASAGKKVSYHDMDDVAEGDVELTY